MFTRKIIPTKELWNNTGQIPGLPKNPRFIKDDRYERLVESIRQHPEMLQLRELIVVEYAGQYVVLCGNMRLRASIDCGITELPCKVLPAETPIEKLKAYAIKDNIAFGTDDIDALAEDWNKEELKGWGMELIGWNEAPQEEEENVSFTKSKKPKITVVCEDEKTHSIVKREIESILEHYEKAKIK